MCSDVTMRQLTLIMFAKCRFKRKKSGSESISSNLISSAHWKKYELKRATNLSQRQHALHCNDFIVVHKMLACTAWKMRFIHHTMGHEVVICCDSHCWVRIYICCFESTKHSVMNIVIQSSIPFRQTQPEIILLNIEFISCRLNETIQATCMSLYRFERVFKLTLRATKWKYIFSLDYAHSMHIFTLWSHYTMFLHTHIRQHHRSRYTW